MDRLQEAEERGALVPGHGFAAVYDVVSLQGRQGDELHITDRQPGREAGVLAPNLLEDFPGPADQVHLVDGHHHVADSEQGRTDTAAPGAQTARVDPQRVSREEATRRLTEAIHVDYDRTKRDFYRFIQQHSLQDVDSRRVTDLIVVRVEEVREDGWVAEFDYFVVDVSRRQRRRQGRFFVRPAEEGVEFIEAY